MSTNSNIVLQIPTSKRGKTYQYEKSSNLDYETPSVTIPSDNANYAQVYVHWDGYVEGVGNDIKNIIKASEKDNNYDELFDYLMEHIIACGDMSTLETPYKAWRNEEWVCNKPKFYEEIPNASNEYQYLITEDKDNVYKVEFRKLWWKNGINGVTEFETY